MNNMFTMEEAINLILNFYTFTQGYQKEEVKECLEACKFIEAGFAKLDEEYPDLYKMNDEGEWLLHSYIKKISEQFIVFLCKNGLDVLEEKATLWFMESYELSDVELAKEICSYICDNLHNYGYKTFKYHSLKKGYVYMVQKINEK